MKYLRILFAGLWLVVLYGLVLPIMVVLVIVLTPLSFLYDLRGQS